MTASKGPALAALCPATLRAVTGLWMERSTTEVIPRERMDLRYKADELRRMADAAEQSGRARSAARAEVWLALYEGAEPAIFTTAALAEEHLNGLTGREARGQRWDWIADGDCRVQWWVTEGDWPTSPASGEIIPLTVQDGGELQ